GPTRPSTSSPSISTPARWCASPRTRGSTRSRPGRPTGGRSRSPPTARAAPASTSPTPTAPATRCGCGRASPPRWTGARSPGSDPDRANAGALTRVCVYPREMKLAAVDIGSNTLLLLVVEVASGGLLARRDECRFGRLGQGLDRSGRLAPEAIERSLAILRDYRAMLDQEGVARLAVVGTQALREADNAGDFLAPAGEILGAPVEVIRGEREAELVFRSVAEALPEVAGGDVVVCDVGGGSTELITGKGGRV